MTLRRGLAGGSGPSALSQLCVSTLGLLKRRSRVSVYVTNKLRRIFLFQLLMIIMPPPIQTGRRHIFYLAVRHYQICEQYNLQRMNRFWHEANGWKWSTTTFLFYRIMFAKYQYKPSLLNKKHIFVGLLRHKTNSRNTETSSSYFPIIIETLA